MSLSSTLSLAQSALANSAAQSAILSSNIANVNNSDYARRSVGTITQMPGSVTLGPTQRATDTALLANLLSATSDSASSQALSDGLTQIASTLGLDSSSATSNASATDQSPSTLIGALQNALQQYAAQPDTPSLATAAITAAKQLAASLNQATASVQGVRQTADNDIAASVKTINSLLQQFKTVNDMVTQGSGTGADVSSAMDQRDGILKQLSNEIGITTVSGANNSMSIYTDSGVTLFETTPRTVSFTPTSAYAAGTVGQAISIDGVPVTGSSAVMPINSGALAGLTKLRDTTSVAYQNQLDQIATGLVNTFAESDQSGGSAPSLAGLFTSPTLTSLPTSTSTGLAATITVNARVDPSVGGTATLLRDGNISSSDPAYTYNTTSASAYSDRLQGLVTALSATATFDASSGGAASGSLATYAQSSVSWLEATRQSATNDASYKSTVVSTTTTALSNATGVNLDDEMSKMLDIEHAYQASAQLLNTVGTMYSALLQAFA
jgi:flagellar hook-associated protein 1 FlgK